MKILSSFTFSQFSLHLVKSFYKLFGKTFLQFPEQDTKNTIHNQFLSIFYHKNYYHDHQILIQTTTNEFKVLLHQVSLDLSTKLSLKTPKQTDKNFIKGKKHNATFQKVK